MTGSSVLQVGLHWFLSRKAKKVEAEQFLPDEADNFLVLRRMPDVSFVFFFSLSCDIEETQIG